jgi:hypothetical protein
MSMMVITDSGIYFRRSEPTHPALSGTPLESGDFGRVDWIPLDEAGMLQLDDISL